MLQGAPNCIEVPNYTTPANSTNHDPSDVADCYDLQPTKKWDTTLDANLLLWMSVTHGDLIHGISEKILSSYSGH